LTEKRFGLSPGFELVPGSVVPRINEPPRSTRRGAMSRPATTQASLRISHGGGGAIVSLARNFLTHSRMGKKVTPGGRLLLRPHVAGRRPHARYRAVQTGATEGTIPPIRAK